MKVSVILISYNNFIYLDDCIKSLGDLSFYHQIIVQDDFSSDLRVIQYFKTLETTNPNILIYQNDKNLGVNENVNLAYSRVTSDYCLITATDDFYHPDFINSLQDGTFILHNSNLPIIYSLNTIGLKQDNTIKKYKNNLLFNDVGLSVLLNQFNLRFHIFNKSFYEIIKLKKLNNFYGSWADRFQLYEIFSSKDITVFVLNQNGSFYRLGVGLSSIESSEINNLHFRKIHVSLLKNFSDLRKYRSLFNNILFLGTIFLIVLKTYYRSLIICLRKI